MGKLSGESFVFGLVIRFGTDQICSGWVASFGRVDLEVDCI